MTKKTTGLKKEALNSKILRFKNINYFQSSQLFNFKFHFSILNFIFQFLIFIFQFSVIKNHSKNLKLKKNHLFFFAFS